MSNADPDSLDGAPPVRRSARALIFLGEVLWRRYGRRPSRVVDKKRAAGFEAAIRQLPPPVLIVLNSKRRSAKDLEELRAALAPDVAKLVYDATGRGDGGRYSAEKRIDSWLKKKDAIGMTWAALEPKQKGFKDLTNVVTVSSAGFDELTAHLLEEGVIWGPLLDRMFPSEFLDASAWIRSAKALLRSLRILAVEFNATLKYSRSWKGPPSPKNPFPDFSVGYTYLMLAGYVFENVLKAAIVRDNRYELKQEFERDGKLPETLKKHDLYRLAQLAGVQPDAKDELFLRRMTQCVEWYGKYPVPSKPRSTNVRFSTGHRNNLRLITRNDPAYFEELLARIVSECGFQGSGLVQETTAASVQPSAGDHTGVEENDPKPE